jgi:hypothetical protein
MERIEGCLPRNMSFTNPRVFLVALSLGSQSG